MRNRSNFQLVKIELWTFGLLNVRFYPVCDREADALLYRPLGYEAT
jgi:hypothetical protein